MSSARARLVTFLLAGLVVLVGSFGAPGGAAAQTGTEPVPADAGTGTGTDPGSDTAPDITIAPIEAPTVDPVDTPDDGDPTLTLTAPESASNSVLLVVLVTLISVVPGLLLLTTTFPRFLIVLGLTRQALGLNTTPPNQVLAGLAAFLTLFVMGPTFSAINEQAIQPATRGEVSTSEALELGWEPMRDFMLDRTRSSDLEMLFELVGEERPETVDDLSPRFVIPAFILSELRTAFLIGFLIWIPFLLIDLIVSTLLAALGMMMMPPVVVSLPVKLALFVLVDGWALIAGSLLRSAGT